MCSVKLFAERKEYLATYIVGDNSSNPLGVLLFMQCVEPEATIDNSQWKLDRHYPTRCWCASKLFKK